MIDVFKNKFYFFKTINPDKIYQDCEGLDIPNWNQYYKYNPKYFVTVFYI